MGLATLRTLLRLAHPYRAALPVLVGLGFLASLSEGLGIGLVVPLLDALTGGGADGGGRGPVLALLSGYAARLDESSRLPVLAASIIGLVLLKSAVAYANTALFARVNGHVGDRLRRAVFARLLDAPYRAVAGGDQGRLLNTLAGETWRATDALAALFSLLVNACTIVVFGLLLFLISWPLAAGVAAGVAAASLAVRLVARRGRRLGAAAVEANAALSARMVETLDAMRTIRAFGQEAREQARFDAASGRVRRAFLAIELAAGVVPPLLETLYAPLFVGALLLAWSAGVPLPALLAFLLTLYRLSPHVRSLDQNRVYLASLAPAVAEVASLAGDGAARAAPARGAPAGRLERGIVFRDVVFAYDPEAPGGPALDGASFEIRRGEVTALVGPSGAGKSTVVNLLLRLYEPDAGEILVDGRPLASLDPAAWRARVAAAGQDLELMAGTVAENIAYGRPWADRAAVEAAARLAGADGFVASLPRGYGTPVGGGGVRLSGGQRQRIALARALLRAPDLLLLDEATNALDGPSDAAIRAALAKLPRGTTTLVVAHRLASIRYADRVVVLDRGRVVEAGRPRDLLAAGGLFARLYAREARGIEAAATSARRGDSEPTGTAGRR